MVQAKSNRLRAIRHAKGISQVELAAKASVSISLLWTLENGIRKVSRRKKLRIASALGLDVAYVFPEEAADGTPLASGR